VSDANQDDHVALIGLRAADDPIVELDPIPNTQRPDGLIFRVVRLGPSGKYEERVTVRDAADYQKLLDQRLMP
jgi:hypothetical protein